MPPAASLGLGVARVNKWNRSLKRSNYRQYASGRPPYLRAIVHTVFTAPRGRRCKHCMPEWELKPPQLIAAARCVRLRTLGRQPCRIRPAKRPSSCPPGGDRRAVQLLRWVSTTPPSIVISLILVSNTAVSPVTTWCSRLRPTITGWQVGSPSNSETGEKAKPSAREI